MVGVAVQGWTGRMLCVDLATRESRRETIPAEFLQAYLGGRGLGVRLMRDWYRLDPYDPAMPLIFAVGPLCGTPAPTAARLSVVSRSPLTGTIYDCSAGGRFAWRLKAAGFDALVVTGKSATPVAIAITPSGAEIVDASQLWGKTVHDTVTALAGRGSVATIGPAGERGVLFANIMMGEGNSVGRGGLGAVMGAKGLKAVVVNGDQPVVIADRERFEKARQDVMRLFRASPVIFGELGIGEYGTPALVDLMRQRRMAPTDNFRRTVFEESGNYSGPAIRRDFHAKKDGCYGCPIQCKKSTPAGEHLPEYETLSHFGGLNGIASLASIVKSNTLCNELGMDTISAAATLSAWGEARGSFPDGEEVQRLLADIAFRRGDGELLSLGSRRVAEALGQPGLSMSVKGLELPAYDPRGAYGMALAYCTSNRGGCHLRAYPISHEILRKPIATDRFSFSGKARIIAIAEDTNAAVDSLVACKFSFFGATLEEYAELLSATTGIDYSPQDLKEIGRRICLTERFYNCDNGFSVADDSLPERFFSEPGSSGEGVEIPPLDRARFDEELQKYYRIRGLTPEGVFADRDLLVKQP
ncbi:Aldehyde ferredoxin oxidoreductase [Geobacter metallireducens RCH3]|uniref:Aldehyde:ferredoxin oxidoreductase, tungsten-containing n=1 Tax=Geobacter metallireducens (strain ATCC 53774 / DSM 7210 / GS-15) TaxID=269799 RepID=Q39TB0_GEOMG|nr:MULTISPECIES: aldehyde ferredoxin oxidoreductase family protein [Geobacter]ABB32514.1 aldehyde:ferredoxin oxidoreductase, tungsten-containing [Geobacter metallireducens GS-15]EHP84363.1 Aldehyde ferredoxin oxidoreductase [Geobacter metallireducens RCH3]